MVNYPLIRSYNYVLQKKYFTEVSKKFPWKLSKFQCGKVGSAWVAGSYLCARGCRNYRRVFDPPSNTRLATRLMESETDYFLPFTPRSRVFSRDRWRNSTAGDRPRARALGLFIASRRQKKSSHRVVHGIVTLKIKTLKEFDLFNFAFVKIQVYCRFRAVFRLQVCGRENNKYFKKLWINFFILAISIYCSLWSSV